MSTMAVVIIVVACVVVLAAIASIVAYRRAQRGKLRQRFGPEYDRAVETSGSPRQAEADLRGRVELRDRLSIRPLSAEQRERAEREWERVQAEFVDSPARSLDQADSLLTKVMVDRGYPMQDFEGQADLISVDHADVVAHYRKAHGIQVASQTGGASTDEIRDAFMAYRELFANLLADTGASADPAYASRRT
ncbi:MAG TPA: hypothetical protein VKT18_05405 [Acidimicrobiales bacterium]|nr:hypothetical protein [Acidimicrobiales bacterium]